MANFDVSDPVYNNVLRKLETSDPAHADTFNHLFQQLLENDEVLNKNLDNVAILEDSGEPPEPEIPTDSDLLGGQPKSYFEGLVNAVSNRVNPIETVYPQLSNPNMLINGDFQIWQRGTSFENHGIGTWKYTADRWKLWEGSVSKVSNGLAITKYASSDYAVLMQVLEEHYDNKNVTLSMSIDGNYYKISGVMNTGASMTLNILGFGTVRAYISSGYNVIDLVLGDAGFHIINWIKLELGEIATPFIPRLYAEELALCQRYYLNSMTKAVIMQGYNNSGSHHLLGNVFYPVEMRIIPTLKIYNSSNGMLNHIRDTSTGADILLTSYIFNSIFNDTKGFSLIVIDGFTPVDGNFYDFRYTLEAEIY